MKNTKREQFILDEVAKGKTYSEIGKSLPKPVSGARIGQIVKSLNSPLVPSGYVTLKEFAAKRGYKAISLVPYLLKGTLEGIKIQNKWYIPRFAKLQKACIICGGALALGKSKYCSPECAEKGHKQKAKERYAKAKTILNDHKERQNAKVS